MNRKLSSDEATTSASTSFDASLERAAPWLREAGIETVWRERRSQAEGAVSSSTSLVAAHSMTDSVQKAVASIPLAAPDQTSIDEPASLVIRPIPLEADWEALRQQVSGCQRCPLAATRRHTVFGVGIKPARWMMIGEAPGADEDASGLPFVGQAGKLLDQMLFAVGLDRNQGLFIANVLKCRPPGNRNPAVEEIAACQDYLFAQIHHVQPQLLILLGKFAALTVLKAPPSTTLGSLRSRVHSVDVPALGKFPGWQVPAIVTYHPAYLLRNQADKAKSWEDLRMAVDVIAPLAD